VAPEPFVQERLIWDELTGDAVSPVGLFGLVVKLKEAAGQLVPPVFVTFAEK
jgi:hypothetical protein